MQGLGVVPFSYIDQTKGNYESKIIVPQDIIIGGVITDEDGNKYKLLSVKYKDGTTKEHKKCFEVKDETGKGTGEYNLPQTVTVVSNKVNATDKTKEIPQINYIFKLKTSKNLFGQTVYNYELETNIDPLIECAVSSLNIVKFEKLDLSNTIETATTEYPADPNPVTQSYIYAKDENGNFEKFLLAYDKSSAVRNQLSSIDSWLYEMMEERSSTVELVDTVKYLLYVYDGVDRGVTEFKLDLFNPSEFANFSNGSGWWWPIGSSNIEIINGLEFARGEPVSSRITSGVGPRWGKNHGGIDISNGIRGTNIIASKAHTPEIGTVIDEAMRSIEKENKRLKDILPKNFARPELDKRRLGEVVDLFTNIQMIEHGSEKDILGRTYEYCLSKFAEQEGKLAGEFYKCFFAVLSLL